MTHDGHGASGRRTVLVVDRDTGMRNSLKFSLEVEGFAVRTYANGDDLLSDSDLPDDACIVVDDDMPGAAGLDLVSELRSREVALPAILITSHPTMRIRLLAATAGVLVIEKPLFGDALVRSIWAVLGS